MQTQSLELTQLKCARKSFPNQLDIKPVDKNERKKNKNNAFNGSESNGHAESSQIRNGFQSIGFFNSKGDFKNSLSNGTLHFNPDLNDAWNPSKPHKKHAEYPFDFNGRHG